ncbi:FAD-dependent oxidoreductase [Pseudonocardia xishanensis]|uniref:FAD-binding oxidoreductase n=1 Tax=Pseudonocardia xishanensis TaxID=630995 RepID=A0ABP8RH29_9PSEU
MKLIRPGEAAFAAVTTGYQTNRPHRPDTVALPRTAAEVREAVALAGDGPLAVQSSGHGRVSALDGGVLISTTELTGVTVDPRARTARIAAGATWGDVVAATTPHGLAPVNGSSPGVGVVGYLRGGGFGILGRAFGYAADRVRSVDGVSRAGDPVRTDRLPADDMVVTAVEIELVEVPRVWGGTLTFTIDESLPAAFAAAVADLPDEVSASLSLVPLPDVPALPPHLRGVHLAQVRVVGTDEHPLDALRTIGRLTAADLRWMPYGDAHTIHSDPTDPHAYAGEARFLRAADPAALSTVVAATGPDATVPSVVEIRQLGGALARPTRTGAPTDAEFLLRAVTALDPVSEPEARSAHEKLVAPFAADDLGPARTFCYGR